MKKFLGLLLLVIAVGKTSIAQDFNYNIPLKTTKGIVKVLSEDLVIIESSADANRRYVARNLPDEYKKNELPVTFSGLEAKIPPHIRMAGRPLHLLCISVSKEDQKKFKLLKSKYSFKKPKPNVGKS